MEIVESLQKLTKYLGVISSDAQILLSGDPYLVNRLRVNLLQQSLYDVRGCLSIIERAVSEIPLPSIAEMCD